MERESLNDEPAPHSVALHKLDQQCGGRGYAEPKREAKMTQIPRRQRPAHPPPVERHNAPVILFVTLTIKPRGNHLANETFHACFVRAGREADAWSIGRYLLMPDHVHLFCAPGMYPPVGIKRWIRYLKERTTKHLHGKAGIMNDDPAPHRVALHEMDQHCGGRGFAEPPHG